MLVEAISDNVIPHNKIIFLSTTTSEQHQDHMAGINNAGHIVGDGSVTDLKSPYHPTYFGAIWDSQHPDAQPVRLPTVSDDHVLAINNLDHVAGSSHYKSDVDGINREQATIWIDHAAIQLGSLNDNKEDSQATDINDQDWVVGATIYPYYHTVPFVWKDNKMVELSTLAAHEGYASAINNAGQIVGHSMPTLDKTHAVTWENGVLHDLTPNSGYASAKDINDKGIIVGTDDFKPVAWLNGGVIQLAGADVKGAMMATAEKINNKNQIIGEYLDATFTSHALYWSSFDAAPVDLSSFFSDKIPGNAAHIKANGINDNGLITGDVIMGSESFGFVLDISNPDHVQLTATSDASVNTAASANIWSHGF